MLHLIIGTTAIVLGVLGIARNWYMFIDMLSVLIPIALIVFGVVALLAGVRSFKKKGK